MQAIIALLMTFGMPVAIVYVVMHYRYKRQELAVQEKQAPKQLASAVEERKQLEARIQNLESIVCSVDFELNQRLNRLAADASIVAKALPAGGEPTSPLPPARATAAPRGLTAPSYSLGQLTVGQVVLGRYTIEREIGHGGMGAVYLAHDAKLGERVALKTISAIMAQDPAELQDRFRREVQAARKVTHPNVIRIHDLGEEGSLMFLSMEYVEGETLWARVRRKGTLGIREALEVLLDVGAGVAAAHAAGVVHRDLKPHNVLLGAGGTVVKVIDFGLAKTSFAAGMTATGLILGTPEYMAPEQIRGGRSDARADIYALGALAFYTLCGRPPFVAETPIAIGFAQIHEVPTPLRQLRPEVPLAVEQVILRSLAKDPKDRYLDAGEWRRALERVARKRYEWRAARQRRERSRPASAGTPRRAAFPARVGLSACA